jgi:hypothetical protein
MERARVGERDSHDDASMYWTEKDHSVEASVTRRGECREDKEKDSAHLRLMARWLTVPGLDGMDHEWYNMELKGLALGMGISKTKSPHTDLCQLPFTVARVSGNAISPNTPNCSKVTRFCSAGPPYFHTRMNNLCANQHCFKQLLTPSPLYTSTESSTRRMLLIQTVH